MIDQAESLRQLVRRVAKDRPPRQPGGVVLVLGPRPGVGTTTTSVNLSIAFAQHGCSVTLVDADFERPHVHRQCGLVIRSTLQNLIEGDRTVREVAHVGPAGISVVPGFRMTDAADSSTAARLAEQVSLLAESRLVVVDLGQGMDHPHLYRLADDVIVVTTVDVPCVIDAYGVMKHTATMLTSAHFWTLVNRYQDPHEAQDVQSRLATSCDRFLNLGVKSAGSVPADPVVQHEDDKPTRPLVLKEPQSSVSESFTAISARLLTARRGRSPSTFSNAETVSPFV